MKKLSIYAKKGNKKQRCLKCEKFKKTCKVVDGDWWGKCLLFKKAN